MALLEDSTGQLDTSFCSMKRGILFLISVLALIALLGYRRIADEPAVSQKSQTQTKESSSFQANSDEDKSGTNRLVSMLKSRNAAIRFYGVVVDEQGNPLRNVKVSWSAMRSGALAPALGLSTGDKGATATDSAGKFSIENSGTSLSIDSLEKNGFREARQTNRTFGYGENAAPHQPDGSKPQHFLMIKEGGAPSYRKEMLLAFDWDGEPKEFEIGVKEFKETLVLIPSRDPDIIGKSNFYWKMVLRPKSGQVIRAKLDDAPLAPDSGYTREIILGDAESKKVGGASALLYLKTDSGKFAELRLRVNPRGDLADGMTADLSLRWNPYGGRTFE